MSRFHDQDLFGSGPHRFQIGGLTLRHVLQPTPGSRGVRLSHQGLDGRAITQTGELLADDPDALHQLVVAIEAQLDGEPRQLIDEFGRAWSNVVMLTFEPSVAARVGVRWRLPYRIQYLQLTP
jgi:hypothetical protein